VGKVVYENKSADSPYIGVYVIYGLLVLGVLFGCGGLGLMLVTWLGG